MSDTPGDAWKEDIWEEAANPKPWYLRIHWFVWAAIAPLVIMQAYKVLIGDGARITIIGSGALVHATDAGAPEGTYYAQQASAGMSLAETEAAIRERISEYPDLFVFGFDAAVLGDSPAERAAAHATLGELVEATENAFGVPIVAGFSSATGPVELPEDTLRYLRTALCPGGTYRVCVELHDKGPEEIDAALAAAVRDGMERRDALHASTQVGR